MVLPIVVGVVLAGVVAVGVDLVVLVGVLVGLVVTGSREVVRPLRAGVRVRFAVFLSAG